MPSNVKSIAAALCLAAACQAHAAGYPELAAAIRAGDTTTVEQLLKAGVPVAAPAGSSAPLLIAASRGQHAIARLLLARGAEPNPRYAAYQNATALMLAVNSKDAAMARLLLDGGAAVDLVDSFGDPALNWAVFHGDATNVELLLQRKANATLVGHGTALEVAMRRGHQALVERLVDYTGQRRTLTTTDARLVNAIRNGDGQEVKLALAAGAQADALDSSGRPVLALAARTGRVDAVRALLDVGATIDAPDAIGFSPLMEAARDGQLEVCKLLIARGANVNQAAQTHGLAMTPLHLAAATGRLEVIRLLVRSHADLEAADTEKATPVMWTGEQDAARKLLLELGAKAPPPAAS